MEKYLNKILAFLKAFVNDKNPIKRGFHRIGFAIGITLSSIAILIEFIIAISGGFSYYHKPDEVIQLIVLTTLTPIVLLFIPIIVAKGIGWVIEGFQDSNQPK
ncbi:MAG: hypothetical protein PVI40_03170 [Chlamydiota bacterium]|jgi:hypothetical protein